MTMTQRQTGAPASVGPGLGLDGRIAPQSWPVNLTTEGQAHQVRCAARLAVQACGDLIRAGCLVLSAQALPQGAVVRVLPPPAWTGIAALRKRTRSHEVLVSRLASGVVVEWCLPRVRGVAV